MWRATIQIVAAGWIGLSWLQGGFAQVGPSKEDLAAKARAVNEPLAKADQAAVELAAANRAAEIKIRQALAKPADFTFKDATLEQVADVLEAKLGVPVRLDRKALADGGILAADAKSASITFPTTKASSRAALDLIFEPLDMSWLIRHETVWITTAKRAQGFQESRAYDISDRNALGEKVFDDDEALIELITSTIEPQSWEGSGPGPVRTFHGSGIDVLVVSQTQRVQEKVEQLLDDLRRRHKATAKMAKPNGVRTAAPMVTEPPSDDTGKPKPPQAETPNHLDSAAANRLVAQKVATALGKPCELEFKNATLEKFAEALEKTLGVPVRVDDKALVLTGIEPKEGITINFRPTKISLRSALTMILEDHDLNWTVRNEVFLLTTKERASTLVEPRLYDISACDKFGEALFDDESILELITTFVEPQLWDGVGGPGSIQMYHDSETDVMVISQTREGHDAVEQLLADLQRMRKPDVGAAIPSKRKRHRDESQENSESAPQVVKLPADPKRDAAVASGNALAFDLYRKLTENHDKNAFFSPHSIAMSLAMVKAGAKGKTADEIASVLHWKGSDADFHAGNAALRTATRGDRESLGFELRVANRLWAQPGLTLQKPFVDTLRDSYGGELGIADFVKEPKAACRAINAWVEDQTANKIRELIRPEMLNAYTRMMLVNAVYFKGDWQSPFEKLLTKRLPFTTSAGERLTAMMTQETTFPSAEFDNIQALALPYGPSETEANAAMLVLLPRKGAKTLADLEKTLSAEQIAKVFEHLDGREVKVYLPKFKLEQRYDGLKGTLAELGMKRAFDMRDAELAGIARTDPPLYLQDAVHQSFIQVDEKGTEAAAATAFAGDGGGAFVKPPKRVVFRADHPFVFLIFDTRTKAILLLGRMTDPPDDAGGGGTTDKTKPKGDTPPDDDDDAKPAGKPPF